MIDGATLRMFTPTTMSRATIIAGSTFSLATFLAAVCAVNSRTGALAELFDNIWLISIPAVLATVAIDICRKRYWGLAVLVGMCIVVALVILIAYYAVSHIEIG